MTQNASKQGKLDSFAAIYLFGGDPIWWVPFIQKFHLPSFIVINGQKKTHICGGFSCFQVFFFFFFLFFCLSFSSFPLLFDILKPKKVPTRWDLWHLFLCLPCMCGLGFQNDSPLSASEKGCFWKRGLFRSVHLLEVLVRTRSTTTRTEISRFSVQPRSEEEKLGP